MRRTYKAGGAAAKTQRPKTLKRHNAPKAARHHSSVATAKEANVEQLTRELAEAREREAATAKVLKVISSAPGELEPVFKAILESALRICEAEFGMLMLHSGDGSFDTRVLIGAPPALIDALLRQRRCHFVSL